MIDLFFTTWQDHVSIDLPSSKSISNRVLMIQKMCTEPFEIVNLSTANDTFLLKNILDKKEIPKEINAEDAGTTYRFLTAWLAFQNQDTKLSGTGRMHERPIGALVSALRQLGANIEYIEKEGFPPLRFHPAQCTQHKIKIQGNISSQYISALLLIAPTLPYGLKLELLPPVLSEDYIRTTIEVMRFFGIPIWQENNIFTIEHRDYIAKDFVVENDWSSAAFFYAWICSDKLKSITLRNLSLKNWIHQADHAIVKLAEEFFQIKTEDIESGICISSDLRLPYHEHITIQVQNYPDLVPTLAVMAVLRQVKLHLIGTSHLKNKESDRALALQIELLKLNVTVQIDANEIWIDATQVSYPKALCFHTYDDHRMAMAFAVLHTRIDELSIQNPDCVSKSFPHYWSEIKKLGN